MTEDLSQRWQNLSYTWQSLRHSIDEEQIQNEITDLTQKSQDPDLWDDQEQAQHILKTLARRQEKLNTLRSIQESFTAIEEFLQEGDDSEEIQQELHILEKTISQLWEEQLFQDPYDEGNAIVTIQAGAGGVDAQDFTEMLIRMYLRYCEYRQLSVDMIEYIHGQEAGVKRAMMIVKGDFAYGRLRQERGVHRLVRISPFNSAGQRHTSFAMMQVLPEMPEINQEDIQISSDDVRVDVFKSQGAGGQSVNTTDSAVRLTHLPTNIVVSIQTERSQLQNKELAFQILRSRLWEHQQAKQSAEQSLHTEDVSISWGNHIRSYVFHPYQLIKDQRSGYETANIQAVMDGDLDDLITSVLISKH